MKVFLICKNTLFINQQIKQNSKQYFGKIYKEDLPFFTTQIENIKEWNK